MARAFNAAGDAACAVKLSVMPGQQRAEQCLKPTQEGRHQQQTTSSSVQRLGVESNALKILSRHRVVDRRPLPQLEPFPFRPDEQPAQHRKKNRGKVPKPSRFVPGTFPY